MRKITSILVTGIIFLFCGCGNGRGNYNYQSVDVTAKNAEAQMLYDNGQYIDSLAAYLEAMQENPKDVDARIGAVKCQIALENYEMALVNLDSAVKVAPQTEELYELYLEISELTDNITVARTAVRLAKNYNVVNFMEKVPSKPILGYESGRYAQRIAVSVESEEEETEIYISVNKVDGYSYSNLDYRNPWPITSGETKLTAYCVKDGIPSESVEATYVCKYPPSVIQFEDPIMEQLVRNTLDKAEEEITNIDCELVTGLDSDDLRTNEMDYDEYMAMKIHSLNDLQYFPNLQYLYLYKQSEIEDYSCIAMCPTMWELYITECGIDDISFVSEMPYLSYLYFENNQVADLSSVIQCKNLRNIGVTGNPLNDISELSNLKNLISLTVNVEQMNDIGLLKQFENLTVLNISRCDDTDLSVLGELTKLQSLSIGYHNRESGDDSIFIKDISYLENLTELTYLSISGLEDLSQVECLKRLKKLQTLNLYNRKDEDPEKDADIIKDLQQSLPQCDIYY